MLITVFLWIAVFLDVLESFSFPVCQFGGLRLLSDGRPSTILKLAVADGPAFDDDVDAVDAAADAAVGIKKKTEYTITVPPFFDDANSDDEGSYPSALHHIHVETLLTKEEAEKCCAIATSYAEETGRWNQRDFDRHELYATCDFPVDECSTLEDYLLEISFDERLFSRFSQLYGIDQEDLEYVDLFCAHYEAKNGDDGSKDGNSMDRLEAHRDGTMLSFTMLLNSENDFEGGGTFYDGLRDVCNDDPDNKYNSIPVLHPGGMIRPNQGDCTYHCGKLLHGADAVTAGKRTVLVGFVNVHERNQRLGVLGEACTEFGRMDVAKQHYERQLQMNGRMVAGDDETPWLQRRPSQLVIKKKEGRFVPTFGSMKRRANPEYQRLRKLKAEDRLLRKVLLPEEEREEIMSLSPVSDFTIL